MLVLSRFTRQVLTIGAEIQVMVVAVNGDTVRLGITAPHELTVRRHEYAPANTVSEQLPSR